MTMEELLASMSKPKTFSRGDLAKGTIVALTSGEIIVDLGAKAEGVLNKKDLSPEELEGLKVGDELEAYVVIPEGDSGQIVLSLFKPSAAMGKRAEQQAKRWQKFVTAMQRKSKLTGRVVEANKGGLVVETDGIRGFLPSSHVGLSNIGNSTDGLAGMVDQELQLSVIEVDPASNRLIFSARTQLSDEVKVKLESLQVGQTVSGKIAAIAQFGLIIDLGGIEGVVYAQETSWEPVEDLNSSFEVGQEIEAKVLEKDDQTGKVSLSIRQLSKDPFEKIAEKFEVDDVVKGIVTKVTPTGVSVALEDNVEGFLPASKLELGTNYEIGQQVSVLVDGIDTAKRRVNLAPFLTSTAGLIYK